MNTTPLHHIRLTDQYIYFEKAVESCSQVFKRCSSEGASRFRANIHSKKKLSEASCWFPQVFTRLANVWDGKGCVL